MEGCDYDNRKWNRLRKHIVILKAFFIIFFVKMHGNPAFLLVYIWYWYFSLWPKWAGDNLFVCHPTEKLTTCSSVAHGSRWQFLCQSPRGQLITCLSVTHRSMWQFVCPSPSCRIMIFFIFDLWYTAILFLLNMYYSYISVTLFV